MKNYLTINLLIFLFFFSAVFSANAGFSVPSYVYTADQISDAQSKAKYYGRPLAFLYADRNTTCGLASSAARDVIEGLKGSTIIVYVEIHKDWKKMPSIVRSAINSDESGDYTPKTIITNSDMSEIIFILPYARKNKRNSLIKDANYEIYYY